MYDGYLFGAHDVHYYSCDCPMLKYGGWWDSCCSDNCSLTMPNNDPTYSFGWVWKWWLKEDEFFCYLHLKRNKHCRLHCMHMFLILFVQAIKKHDELKTFTLILAKVNCLQLRNWIHRFEECFDCVSGHTLVSGVYKIISPVTNSPILLECVMMDGYWYTVNPCSWS